MSRIEQLRSYEDYAYQVAYYLLGKEELALAAAQQALLAVAADEAFYSLPAEAREHRFKRQVMMKALAVRMTFQAQSPPHY